MARANRRKRPGRSRPEASGATLPATPPSPGPQNPQGGLRTCGDRRPRSLGWRRGSPPRDAPTRGPGLESALFNVIPGWARIGRTKQAFDSRLLHFEARLPRVQVKRPRGWAHVPAATEAPSLRPRRCGGGRLSPPGRARGGGVPGLPAFVLQKPPLKCPVRLSLFDVFLHPFHLDR